MQFDLFGPEVLGLEPFASGDSTRYALTGIHLERGRAVASDGKMMLIVPSLQTDEFPDSMVGDLTPLPREGVNVPPKALKRAFAFVDRKSRIESIRGVVAAIGPKDQEGNAVQKVTLVGTDLETTGTVRSRLIEGTYPDVDAVLPKTQDHGYQVVLAADCLKALTAYASKHGDPKAPGIRFGFNPKDAAAAVRIDFKLPDGRIVTGAIMPMKGVAREYDPSKAEPATAVPEKKPEASPAPAAAPAETKKARRDKKEAA